SYVAADFVAARDAWLDECLDSSSVIEPGNEDEAWVDLRGHPDPRDVAERLALRVGEATGLPVVCGMAPSKWVAKLAARPVDLAALRLGVPVIEPVFDPVAFVGEFPTTYLVPVEPEHRERLARLGYRRVRHVQQAPFDVLRAQFGQSASVVAMAARGASVEPVRAVYPVASLSMAERCEEGVADSLALQDWVSRLFAQASAALVARDNLCTNVRLAFEFEGGTTASWSRTLAKPVQSHQALVGLGSYAAQSLQVQEPVVGLRLLLHGLVAAPRVQMSFGAAGAARERRSAMDAAMRRVKTVYGDTAVRQAGDIKLPRREELLKVWRDALGWR
ncbi:MAG: hypothetical protein JSS65_14790, partial [Armatimonadetes bacterium]|nr:hypothetical protein [Armatimonadota bacterium]